jgi:hypothetical protein
MPAFLAPDPIQSTQLIPGGNTPAAGALLFCYQAGTSTKMDTYTDPTASTARTNPIVLDSGGNVPGNGEVWIASTAKFVLAPSNDTDPPGSPYWTRDNYSGINNIVSQLSSAEWVSGPTPTFLSSTSFVLAGDQTNTFTENRRIKTANTGGTVYGYIQNSVFGTSTTISIVPDSGSLDSGLSSVSYGLLNADNESVPQNLARNVLSVKDKGAIGDGVTDDTAAIQAAIDSFASGNGLIFFPVGTYKITGTITLTQDRVHLVGAGISATMIDFQPTANDTLFEVGKSPANVLFQGSIRDMTLYGTDTTYTKIAIDLLDTSGFLVENIFITGAHSSGGAVYWGNAAGNGSIGLKCRGREFGLIRNFYCYAQRPILISANPNSTIDIDHFHFFDTYLSALGNPIVEIETGVNLSNVTFDGAQPWVGGTDGLYWVDTTTSQKSYMFRLENIRWEQGTNVNSYMARIEHNNGLQGLTLRNCVGEDRKGFYFRNIDGVTLDTVRYGRASEAANWATTYRISIKDCFWQSSSTATLANVRLIWAMPYFPNTGGLPNNAYYDDSTNANRTISIEGTLTGADLTIANDGTAELSVATFRGYVFLTRIGATQAIFELKGSNNTVAEIADSAGHYTVTSTNAGTTNIYWSGGNNRYEIENKLGSQETYKVVYVGFWA